MSNLFAIELAGRKFNFQPFNAGDITGYHVDVKDTDGARYEFRIEHDEDHNLKFEGENLPEWLLAIQDEIKEALDRQE